MVAQRKFAIDEEKVKWEERFDGRWVLQTDLEQRTAEETALQYKQLWTVEEMFRTVKTLLETRPIFHKCDETIRGQLRRHPGKPLGKRAFRAREGCVHGGGDQADWQVRAMQRRDVVSR
jgi:hypothetical protein